MAWWTRPLVRVAAAIVLPLAVPAVITAALWALPGDPAEIICPPGICEGTQALAERWGLDQGPVHFYTRWIGLALSGDLGNSWRVAQGVPVTELVGESIPSTTILLLLSLVPLTLGAAGAALGWVPKRLDALWQGIGLVPSVILALIFAAAVQITYGAMANVGPAYAWRLVCGALVLGLTDGALAGAVVGTRAVFEEELKQRYVQIAILRGESELSNALPNVLPALVGQLRARVLHVLSGAVVVEVVLGIPGIGELLWVGTLKQDFGVVLAAAWVFSLLSGALLLAQALTEVGVALYVRRAPKVVAAEVGAA